MNCSSGNRVALALLASLSAAASTACRPHSDVSSSLPDPLHVGVLPDQAKERLLERYAPLVRHLAGTLGVRTELIVPGSYEELGERFHRGEVDLAYFGGATFVEAERRDGAVPLVMRIVDRHFTSTVIARAGLPGRFPEDFRGRSFVFGARSSTSGHRMPRYFFLQTGLVPEEHFASVAHLPTHDAVIDAIQQGEADAGVVNTLVLRRRIEEGSAEPRRLRQVWESPPYGDYVWAAPPRIALALRARIRDAFLSLDAEVPRDAEVLARLQARAYVPATRSDFRLVRSAVFDAPRDPAHGPR